MHFTHKSNLLKENLVFIVNKCLFEINKIFQSSLEFKFENVLAMRMFIFLF